MQFALNKLRNAARVLLTLDEKDPKRIFEGEAIMRRMYRYGLLVRHPPSRAVVFTAVERSDAARPRASERPRARFSLGFRLQIVSSCILSPTDPSSPLLFQDETQDKLDYVLALSADAFLERRLQTLVFKLGLAKSVHHARVLIRQRHIRVGKQIVNVPSFLVRTDSQKHIDFALNSPLGGGRPGRVKRKRMAAAGRGGGDDDAEEEDE